MSSYIIASEFLNQTEKVRKVLIDWWKPQPFDLYSIGDTCIVCCIYDYYREQLIPEHKGYYIPILQVHQLMKFIEDNGVYLDICTLPDKMHEIHTCKLNGKTLCEYGEVVIVEDLLMGLWKVAVKIVEDAEANMKDYNILL